MKIWLSVIQSWKSLLLDSDNAFFVLPLKCSVVANRAHRIRTGRVFPLEDKLKLKTCTTGELLRNRDASKSCVTNTVISPASGWTTVGPTALCLFGVLDAIITYSFDTQSTDFSGPAEFPWFSSWHGLHPMNGKCP